MGSRLRSFLLASNPRAGFLHLYLYGFRLLRNLRSLAACASAFGHRTICQDANCVREMDGMKPAHGRSRVIIEEVAPQIDAGQYPVCRIVGDEVQVTTAIFADGHDHLAARLLYRHNSERRWRSSPMTATSNDLWTGYFLVDKLGAWSFTIEGWIDYFDTWASDLKKRLAVQSEDARSGAESQNIPLALRSGAILIQEAAKRARGTDAKRLMEIAKSLGALADQEAADYDNPITPEIQSLVSRYPDLAHATR